MVGGLAIYQQLNIGEVALFNIGHDSDSKGGKGATIKQKADAKRRTIGQRILEKRRHSPFILAFQRR